MPKNQLLLIDPPAAAADPYGISAGTANTVGAAAGRRSKENLSQASAVFRLDERTRALGRQGVAAAREALRLSAGRHAA